MENGAEHLGSDPRTTQGRVDSLRDYFARHLLAPIGMVCSSLESCRGSALHGRNGQRKDVKFAEAQLPHVGPHYDLLDTGRPLRVLIVGMEMGEPEELVDLDRRRAQILQSAAKPMTQRNPHMQGVTNALRLALGRPTGADRHGEIISFPRGPAHIFDACAASNVRLCSAFSPGRKSKATAVMTKNCLRHLAASIHILEPTIVIAQGEVGQTLWPIVDEREDAGPHLSRISVRGVSTVLARFSHPSTWGN